MRLDKDNYYLNIAESVLANSTCLRRKYGAVIVKNDEIISSGYNGAPRGRENCCDIGSCKRNKLNVPSGQRYELCRSVHAEQNAIISASRKDMINSVLYLVGIETFNNKYVEGLSADCCTLCKRMIINAGIKKVIIRLSKENYKTINVSEWIEHDDTL